ncbi:hypothetical protein PO909_016324 [Leuciscus waleckii]
MSTAAIKLLMIKQLEDLLEKELNKFIWYLSTPPTKDIKPIPKARLQNADPQDVVDHMVSQYCANAGNIAVQVLRHMDKNDLASELEGQLQEVQRSEPEDRRNASVSVEDQPIQSDWKRPDNIIQSSQEFKDRILKDKKDDVYIPKDKSRQGTRKRLALLITNIRFKHLKYRAGAARDEDNMKWLLEDLGYRVEKYRDLTGQEISTRVEDFAARPEHKDSDSTFVVLMSHGDIIQNKEDKGVKYEERFLNKDAILGVNYHESKNPNDFFIVDDIFSNLNSEKCPALIYKPKVILIQACRGEHLGGVEIQSDSAVHIEKDFFCFKSCLPGISAYRDRVEGSFFICYIVEVFCKWAHTDDIMELFRKVTLRMEKDTRFKGLKKLMPCIDRTSPPKKLYLFPGL